MKAQPKAGRRYSRGKSNSGKQNDPVAKTARFKRVRPLAAKQFVHILEHINDGLDRKSVV